MLLNKKFRELSAISFLTLLVAGLIGLSACRGTPLPVNDSQPSPLPLNATAKTKSISIPTTQPVPTAAPAISGFNVSGWV